MLRAWIALLAAALPLSGCGLISDFHTGDYSLLDSGLTSCMSANDCDASEVCCVATLSPITASCRSGPCPNISELPLPVQLCQGKSECGSADCAVQSCQFLGQSIDIAACGVVAMCSAVPDASVVFDAAPPPAVDGSSSSPFDGSLGLSD